ncbi:MAG: hypothetical protein GY880_23465 [Planctomycetaceae bacterium]|nr:hypothetical protein [Planctomycetaceae bacterium]
MEIERGIQKSIKYAIVGFLIPVFSVGVYWIVYSMFYDIHPIDRENDLARLPLLILVPSTGLAVIFGLSGYASFAPKRGISFIRSLIIIAGLTAIAVYSIQPKVHRKTVEQGSSMEIAIPIAAALIATVAILFYSNVRSNCRPESNALDSGDEVGS